MKRLFLIIIGFLLSFSVFSQEDWTWWNEIHGWEPGMPGWKSFMILSPGYLGPNALTVPEVKKGYLDSKSHFELGTDFHFKEGDNTQNLYGNLYIPFADQKIAIELYGVAIERYAMSREIRDERFARDYDGKGWAVGDLYFSTLIQLFKNRKFPDSMVRLACKTASGDLDAARYSDSPAYFFDFSFSKNFGKNDHLKWLPFVSAGFYCWQTTDYVNLQNDAAMYAVGLELTRQQWKITNSISGYSGYKEERDKPLVYTLDVTKELGNNAIRFQFLAGLRDWDYRTIKISYSWKWD